MTQVTMDAFGQVTDPEILRAAERYRRRHRDGPALGRSIVALKQAALQAHRERVLLQILAPFRELETSDLYGRFVQACAERGWAIVGYRRFVQVLQVIEENGRVRRETHFLGVRGTVSVVTFLSSGPTVPVTESHSDSLSEDVSR